MENPSQEKPMIAKWEKLIVPLLGMLLWVAFLSVLTNEYLHTDDYFFRESANFYPRALFDFQIQIGRPINAVLDWSAFSQVQLVSQAAWIRGLGLVLLTVLYSVLVWLFNKRLRVSLAATLAFLIVTLPAFQVYVSWANCVFYTLAVILTVPASMLLWRRPEAEQPPVKVSQILLSLLLLTMAMLIYQPAAMFFWVPVYFLQLHENPLSRAQLKSWLALGGVFGASLVIGYLAHKIGVTFVYSMYVERGGFVTDVFSKLQWFHREPLIDAFNFQSIRPTPKMALCMVGLGVLGVILCRDKDRKFKILILIATLGFLFITYIPNLLVVENWSSYRTQGAIGSIALIFVFLGLRRLTIVVAEQFRGRQWITVIAVFQIAIAVSFAFTVSRRNVAEDFVLPAKKEWEFLRSLAFTFVKPETETIVLRCADWRDNVNGFTRYDEFGVPTSYREWSARLGFQQAMLETGTLFEDIELVLIPHDEPLPELAFPYKVVLDLSTLDEAVNKPE